MLPLGQAGYNGGDDSGVYTPPFDPASDGGANYEAAPPDSFAGEGFSLSPLGWLGVGLVAYLILRKR